MILIKIINKINHIFYSIRFRKFELRVKDTTWLKHDEILSWADQQSKINENDLEKKLLESDEIIVENGFFLRNKILKEFKDKYTSSEMKILIHVPLKQDSPGGYSAFINLVDSLRFIGVETEILFVGESIKDKLEIFNADIFISSDNNLFLSKIDWFFLNEYKIDNKLLIGLTASIEEYGNSPLITRLEWAKKNGVDFYYSFRSPEYFNSRLEYKPFFEFGYSILSVEFGANPLIYYPVNCTLDKLDYIFLASSNRDKQKRYFDWLPNIFKKYKGFIDGPGWSKIQRYSTSNSHKFLYSRSKIGINLHIDDSIEWESELNERTYILAACGIPQLVDNAKLLLHRFSEDMLFIANNPQEYNELFEFIIKNPNIAKEKALKSLIHVFTHHTTFHRAESFFLQLKKLIKKNELI